MQDILKAYWADQTDKNLRACLKLLSPWIKAQTQVLFNKFYTSKGVVFSYDDIANETEYGFVLALQYYRPNPGTTFKTYANTRSTWAVQNYLREIDVLSRRDREEGREVYDVSLDQPAGENETVADFIAAKKETEHQEISQDFWMKVHYTLRHKPRSRLIINLMFREGWTAGECAKYFDIHVRRLWALRDDGLQYLAKSAHFKKWLLNEPGTTVGLMGNYGETFKIPYRISSCATVDCSKSPYRRGRCWACWHERYDKKDISTIPLSGTPHEMMQQMLERKHAKCSLGIFWQKVFHTCYDEPKGRIILNLMFREKWSLPECAKFYSKTIEQVGQERDKAIGFLIQSKPFQRWLNTGELQGFSTQTENNAFVIPVLGCVCATINCKRKVFCRGRCRSCYRKKYVMEAQDTQKACTKRGCKRRMYCRGYCQPHYQVLFRKGFFLPAGSPKCPCGNKMQQGLKRCHYCINLEKVNLKRIEKMKDPVYKAKVVESQKKYAQKTKEKNQIIVFPQQTETLCAATG